MNRRIHCYCLSFQSVGMACMIYSPPRPYQGSRKLKTQMASSSVTLHGRCSKWSITVEIWALYIRSSQYPINCKSLVHESSSNCTISLTSLYTWTRVLSCGISTPRATTSDFLLILSAALDDRSAALLCLEAPSLDLPGVVVMVLLY